MSEQNRDDQQQSVALEMFVQVMANASSKPL
jgi:hypothetical protein